MKKIFILIAFVQFQFIYSQIIVSDYPLSKIIEETSGLEIIGDYFITHNDSKGYPILYYLSKEGKIIKRREVKSAVNKDWEDITKDDKYIYISDTGNNYSNRKDLKIYKIPINENSAEKTQIISFNYPEQDSFKINTNTIFDAEGLISIDDKLLIFTKNRKKKITEIYSIPKIQGDYRAKKIKTLNVNSIITGADYNSDFKLLALTSTIDFTEYYLITVSDFNLYSNNDYQINMIKIPIGKTQVEAVKIIDKNNFWITSEDESGKKYARLLRLKI
jgi:hypothetical protein